MDLIAIGIIIGGMGLVSLLIIIKSYWRRYKVIKSDRILFFISVIMIFIGITLSIIGSVS